MATKKWSETTGGERAGIGCAAIVLFLIAGLIVSVATTPKPPKPTSIAAISKQVRNVSNIGGYVTVEIELGEGFDDAGAVLASQDIVLDAIKVMQSGATDAPIASIKKALFSFTVPTRTAFGEEGRADLMSIIVTGDDIRRAKPAKMTAFDVVDIGEVDVPSRIGAQSVAAYCAKYATYSPRFCLRR